MKSLGKLLGNFIVENDNGRHLFKVFFYEKGITFDEKFSKGVMEHEKAYVAFNKINLNWSSGKCERNEIMQRILHFLNNYQSELHQYFYSDEELDENGKLIEKSSSENDTQNLYKDKYSFYFNYIKENKDLKEIKRKEFESKITNNEIGDFYVENFEDAKEKAKFYNYQTDNMEESYIMVVDEKIKIGFVEQ